MNFEIEFEKGQKTNKPEHKRSFRAFWMSFILILVGTSIQHIGIKIPDIFHQATILSPVSQNANIFDDIKSRLEQTQNDYKVKKQTGFITTTYAQDLNDYDNATSYLVMDYDTGDEIAGKDTQSPVPIASLTKIMTSVVALDLLSPQELLTVQKDAEAIPPTRIGVKEGQKYT